MNGVCKAWVVVAILLAMTYVCWAETEDSVQTVATERDEMLDNIMNAENATVFREAVGVWITNPISGNEDIAIIYLQASATDETLVESKAVFDEYYLSSEHASDWWIARLILLTILVVVMVVVGLFTVAEWLEG